MARQVDANNPFQETAPRGYPVDVLETVDAASRLDMVKRFGVEKLKQVIALPGVQKVVRTADERRLRKLERAR